MQNFRNLRIWEKSHLLTLAIYEVTTPFPKHEMFGLTSQMRRSAMSVPMNIAEGCGRGTDADFARFLQIAMGSSSELEYQLDLAHDLKYLTKENHSLLSQQTSEVKRMIAVLIRKLKG